MPCNLSILESAQFDHFIKWQINLHTSFKANYGKIWWIFLFCFKIDNHIYFAMITMTKYMVCYILQLGFNIVDSLLSERRWEHTCNPFLASWYIHTQTCRLHKLKKHWWLTFVIHFPASFGSGISGYNSFFNLKDFKSGHL